MRNKKQIFEGDFFRFLLFLFFFFIFNCLHYKAFSENTDSLLKVVRIQPDGINKAETLFELSNKFRTQKLNYSNAKFAAQECIKTSEKINFSKGIYKGKIALGYAVRDLGKNQEAIQHLKTAIQLFDNNFNLNSDKSLFITQVYSCTALSEVFMHFPDYKNAELFAIKALELSEKYHVGEGQCWMNIANIFFNQQNYTESKINCLKAKDYFEKNNSFDDLARCYSYLGNIAYNQNDTKGSLIYYQKALENYKKVQSLIGERITLYNLAEINLGLKDYEKAKFYVDETLKIDVQVNDHIYNFYINLLKCNICIDKGDFICAINSSKITIEIANQQGDLLNQSTALEYLSKSYLLNGDTVNAFLTVGKLQIIKDSIYKKDIAKSTIELTKKYEANQNKSKIAFLELKNFSVKTEYERELLKSKLLEKDILLKDNEIFNDSILKQNLIVENKIKQKTIQNGNELNRFLKIENELYTKSYRDELKFKWLLIFFILILLGFTFSFFKNYKRQKRDNDKIFQQSENLKVLMNELNHRVKNNYQIIISMLRIQSRALAKSPAAEILIETSNRFQAISKVHEQLYRVGDHNNISLKKYLEDLFEKFTFQVQKEKKLFEFTIKDDLELIVNFDSLIPISLIVHELLTNSIKHATINGISLKVNVEIVKAEHNFYRLIFSDNGPGLSIDINESKSFGITLLKLFAAQLGGSIHSYNENGAVFNLNFKLKN